MMRKVGGAIALLGMSLLFNEVAAAADGLRVVGDSEFSAALQRQDRKQAVKGRVGLAFKATRSDLRRGQIEVTDLNILFRQVDQRLLSGKKPAAKLRGPLGLHLNPRSRHVLKYEDGKVKGKLAALASFPQITELTRPRTVRGGHEVYHPEVPADVSIEWTTSPLELLNGCGPGPLVVRLRIGIRIRPNPITGEHEVISWTDEVVIGGRYGCLSNSVVHRELCVVPVSIRSALWDTDPTGQGLAFGWPQVEEQWRKANVDFDLRNTVTITNSDLKTVTQAEMGNLLPLVESDDCAEVFFTEAFSPASLFGGGVTFSSGTSNAKVISSDQNVNGIDFTHLAHELGHVMGLTHPGDGNPSAARPNVTDGSSGTLMCPSGFQNDNPQVNSEDNELNLSSPLFKLKLRKTDGTPDCAGDSDCGSC